jgi:hypothetical protein
MSVWVLEKQPTLQVINQLGEKTLVEWPQEYPDRWLFLEITDEDEWEIRRARLVAVADDPGEFTEMCREYLAQNIVHMVMRGHFGQEQALLVG